MALSLQPSAVRADAADIEQRCNRLYPSITQYFSRRDCVKHETQKEAAEQEKRAREERARPCIAADIARIEGLAQKANTVVNQNFSLEQAQSVLAVVFGNKAGIGIPDDDLKERVLIQSIRTKCDSDFYFLINIRAAQDGTLRWYRTWAENAPTGYKGGYKSEFSTEFDQERALEQSRIEAKKRQESLDAALAKAEHDRQEQRRKLLNGIKISNGKVVCLGTCAFGQIEFDVTNASSSPVAEISFGWMIRPPNMAQCPTNLATNKTLHKVLQPGQVVKDTVYFTDAPQDVASRICIQVTDMRTPYPWEK